MVALVDVLTGPGFQIVLPRITPNISPAPGQDDDLLGIYISSLRALADIPAEEVLPAHEYRFAGLTRRINGLLGHHEERLGVVMTVVHAASGCTSVAVAEALTWSRPWDQMVGPQRRFAIGEAFSHLVHLERTGYLVNKGLDPNGAGVDSWFPLRDTVPKLLQGWSRRVCRTGRARFWPVQSSPFTAA